MHIHVQSSDGEAKFWLEPSVSLVHNYGMTQKQLREVQEVIEEKKDEIQDSWQKHFRR